LDHTDTALLISRCREGDASAVEALVQTHKASVFRLALSMLDDPAEADEAAQDAFVAAIGKLHSYRGESSFTTWLYAITLNVCRGRLRKRRARERLAQVLHALFRAGGESGSHPEHVVIQHETDRAVWRAIQALDDRQREPVILRYYHDLSAIEIARVLGVSDRTVRARLHAAHERIRELLTGKADLR